MTAGPGDTAVVETPSKRSPALRGALEIVETLVLTVVIFFVVHTFVAQPFRVEQGSMETTLLPDQYVLVDKLTPRWSTYERGDIVVFESPESFSTEGGAPLIKRVIGLPGDRIDLQDDHVLVNGIQIDEPYLFLRPDGDPGPTKPSDGTTGWVVPDGSLFVLGDHRTVSADSRQFGPIAISRVLGRATLRYWPIDRFGTLDRPTYPELVAG
jgi:signal peptidase I